MCELINYCDSKVVLLSDNNSIMHIEMKSGEC